MEWIFVSGMLLWIVAHTSNGAGAQAAIGTAPAAPVGNTDPTKQARPPQTGAPGGDVLGDGSQTYGKEWGNNPGDPSPYPAGPQFWLPISKGTLGGAATGGASDTGVAPGSPMDQRTVEGGFIIGRGY